MRVLPDSCVPRRLANDPAQHEVTTAARMGWADLDDGPLLDAMAQHFDILVSVDKSLPKQQNLAGRPFAIVILRGKSNRLADLRPLIPKLLAAISEVRPGEVREIAG